MARVFSPTTPDKEREGFLEAAHFFTAPGRDQYSPSTVLFIAGQYCQRLRSIRQGDRANGFEFAAMAIAQGRSGGDDERVD